MAAVARPWSDDHMAFTAKSIPDLTGKTAIVTGATSGLGLASARALAAKGAHVVMTARDPQRGDAALADVRQAVPQASVEVRALDTSSLASVRDFAAAWSGPVDILMNNAGVMALPFDRSADGVELQFATNHLGHFALTTLLRAALEAAPAARVVNVSSVAATQPGLPVATVAADSDPDYDKWKSYSRSKLANLHFTMGLDQKLRAAGSSVQAIAAHPGLANTNLFRPDAGRISKVATKVGQSAANGALPQLFAATAPTAKGGQYFGPRILQARGAPTLIKPKDSATDAALIAELWDVSQDLSGLRWS